MSLDLDFLGGCSEFFPAGELSGSTLFYHTGSLKECDLLKFSERQSSVSSAPNYGLGSDILWHSTDLSCFGWAHSDEEYSPIASSSLEIYLSALLFVY